MHGNTERTGEGRKTRNFERVVSEFEATIRIHKSLGTKLGGIHLEMTNEDVTECLGGSSLLTELDLSRRYETWCDPRLNGNQSLEMAFVVAEQLAGRGPQSH